MANVTLPNTLTANTLAQASQVMANLQAIVTQVNGNLDATNLKDGAVTEGKVAAAAINTTELADEAVTNAKMAAAAVDTANIVDDAVTGDKVADGSIGTAHLAADAVDGTKIADDSIDSEHYVDGSIDTAHLADDAVTPDKTSFFGPKVIAAGWANWDPFLEQMSGRGNIIFTRVGVGNYRLSASGVTAGATESLIAVATARRSGGGTYHTCSVVGSSSTYVEVQVRTEAGVAADITVEAVLLLV